jgi:2-oxo-4-hydroxy-4-carboxy-5-ureidoimidazoline decarboxylase
MVTLTAFNAAEPQQAADLIRPCLDVDRWVDELVSSRPQPDRDTLLKTARTAAEPFTTAELEQALAHHPRIGQQASGNDTQAQMSRGEQSAATTTQDVQQQLRAANAAYEQRFGHVFLIRAAGRTAPEILGELERRMTNDEAGEWAETADQLRQIAVSRLQQVVTS